MPAAPATEAEVTIDGPWEFELKPTLDNRWGDFRLPASDGLLGAEARQFAYAEETTPNPGWEKPSTDVSGWRRTTCGFGPRFWKLRPVPPGPETDAMEATLKGLDQLDSRVPVTIAGREYRWQPYEYSLRYGVEGDPGHQGYHGLKGAGQRRFPRVGCQAGHDDRHGLRERARPGTLLPVDDRPRSRAIRRRRHWWAA